MDKTAAAADEGNEGEEGISHLSSPPSISSHLYTALKRRWIGKTLKGFWQGVFGAVSGGLKMSHVCTEFVHGFDTGCGGKLYFQAWLLFSKLSYWSGICLASSVLSLCFVWISIFGCIWHRHSLVINVHVIRIASETNMLRFMKHISQFMRVLCK